MRTAQAKAPMQMDLFEGRRLRDKGIQQAADHADQEINWTEQAYSFLLVFLATDKGADFMAEDVRLAAEGIVPKPPDGRAWGWIIMRAVRAKEIHRTGFRAMKSKNCHANPKSVWSRIGK